MAGKSHHHHQVPRELEAYRGVLGSTQDLRSQPPAAPDRQQPQSSSCSTTQCCQYLDVAIALMHMCSSCILEAMDAVRQCIPESNCHRTNATYHKVGLLKHSNPCKSCKEQHAPAPGMGYGIGGMEGG